MTTRSVPAVTLEGASRAYGPIQALAPLSLTVEEGETVALLGPSGAGKTTLLSLISGGLQPTAGRVFLRGRDLAEMRPGADLARDVGMLHQQFDLVPNLSALQNVLAGRLGQWGLAKSLLSLLWPRDRRLGLDALDMVGVADRAYHRAGRLSGGEQQRVAVARLLVQDPAVLLADEPVASLDPAHADRVIGLLASAAREAGKTLVASIHLVALAREHFSRIVGLRSGVVQFDLPTMQVTAEMLDRLYDLRRPGDEP